MPDPIEWLANNGGCYTARDTLAFAREIGLIPRSTPVSPPQSNGMAEAFVRTLKCDDVRVNPRPDAQTVLDQLPRWIAHYNEVHPHRALGYRLRREYIAKSCQGPVMPFKGQQQELDCSQCAVQSFQGTTGFSARYSMMYQKDRKTGFRIKFPSLPSVINNDTTIINQRISALDCICESPYKCFGLDLKVNYYLETNDMNVKSRKVFYRPAQEPIILGSLKRLKAFDFDKESALTFATLICGKKAELRSGDIWATDSEKYKILFEVYDEDFDWIDDIKNFHGLNYPPVIEAIITYSRIIFYHPFRDGNGRFARAAFYGVLARNGILRSPCLAIGATFDWHREELAAATLALSKTGAWAPYFQILLKIIGIACGFAMETLDSELTVVRQAIEQCSERKIRG